MCAGKFRLLRGAGMLKIYTHMFYHRALAASPMERFFLIISLTITLILMTNNLQGQNEKDRLKNLSYHVVGVIGNKEQVGGTGFFIKKGTAFYLVSAWHSFSFKNHLTQNSNIENSQLITEIVVYRNLVDIKTNKYSRIDLIDSTTKQPTYLSIYQSDKLLDISAIQINRHDSFNFDYYDVDSANTKVKASIKDDAFYYGFPIKNGRQNDVVEYFEGKISEMDLEGREVTIDIVGYTGCSGAPLFVRVGQRKYLWGVLFYALKDSMGIAERCKAVDLTSLIERL